MYFSTVKTNIASWDSVIKRFLINESEVSDKIPEGHTMDRTIYSFPITVKASKSMNTNAFVKIVPVRACKDAME